MRRRVRETRRGSTAVAGRGRDRGKEGREGRRGGGGGGEEGEEEGKGRGEPRMCLKSPRRRACSYWGGREGGREGRRYVSR